MTFPNKLLLVTTLQFLFSFTANAKTAAETIQLELYEKKDMNEKFISFQNQADPQFEKLASKGYISLAKGKAREKDYLATCDLPFVADDQKAGCKIIFRKFVRFPYSMEMSFIAYGLMNAAYEAAWPLELASKNNPKAKAETVAKISKIMGGLKLLKQELSDHILFFSRLTDQNHTK